MGPDASTTKAAALVSYRFGHFELQPGERRLFAAGNPVSIGPRAFDLLVALVERAGQLVAKRELIDRVWPKLVVEENNLPVQITYLRKILGSAAVETIAGHGYRFNLPVERMTFEPARVATIRRHSLPLQLTSFIGHEDDLDTYAALLAETRLLTLTGIGGCGKTRLAIKIAERVAPSFGNGVWYVDLAPLLDAERVALAVATVLGIREESDRALVDTLCGQLARQHALLILDNCEHLVAACADLVHRVLLAAPDVRVLAASREALGVPGERKAAVRSLVSPPAELKQDLAMLATCESVRLFVDRAQLSRPEFALGDDTAEAVAEICRRLDGIPLAIELAAARVNLLSVQEIRDRLDDRFRLLTRGARGGTARQQTLQATIQWSYDHLAVEEQQLLRRLSVFVGGWTLLGATRVAAPVQHEYAVLDLLARLVDRSLVTSHLMKGGATTRYSMLETVRQYAYERLAETGEVETIRNRHLEFYVRLATEAEPNLVGPEQGTWFARLEAEQENLLAAHAWCRHADEFAERGMRIVSALSMYMRQRLLLSLGYRLAVEALARPGAQRRSLARCRALWTAGEFSYFLGRYQETRDYAATSLAIARELPNEHRAAEALRLLGYAALGLGDREMAHRHMDESLALSRKIGDRKQLMSALSACAQALAGDRAWDKAEPLYDEALALSRSHGDRGGTAIALSNLAFVLINRGSADRAREMLREALGITDEIGATRAGIAVLLQVADLAASSRDWKFSARLHAAAESLSGRTGRHFEPDEEIGSAPFIARTREAIGTEAFDAAQAAGRALGYEQAIAEARAWLGT